MTKRCSKCGTTKPLDEFHRHKLTADGRAGLCIECHRRANRAYDARRKARPKRCPKCGETKPRKAFEAQRKYCRACRDALRPTPVLTPGQIADAEAAIEIERLRREHAPPCRTESAVFARRVDSTCGYSPSVEAMLEGRA